MYIAREKNGCKFSVSMYHINTVELIKLFPKKNLFLYQTDLDRQFSYFTTRSPSRS